MPLPAGTDIAAHDGGHVAARGGGQWKDTGFLDLERCRERSLHFYAVITIGIGYYLFPIIGRRLGRMRTAEFEFTALVVVAMTFAVLAELLGLHFVVGAFLAGLFFEKRTAGAPTYANVERKSRASRPAFWHRCSSLPSDSLSISAP